LRKAVNGKRNLFCEIIVCPEADSKAGVKSKSTAKVAKRGKHWLSIPHLFFFLGDPGVLAVDPRRVESRGVLPYSNSAFEAGPNHFFPNALRRSFDAPKLFVIFAES
jgi:hypothetical protein